MLKVIHTSGLPASFPVDPVAEFQAGMICQLQIRGNDISMGISDSSAPFGIIDDVRTSAFTRPQVDEVVEILLDESGIETDLNGHRVNVSDVTGFLSFPNIVDSSFTATKDVVLNAINGAIIVPAGTELNYDSDDDDINDGFKIITNYIYRVVSKPGDDSTLGSGRITAYYTRGIYATDQYEPGQLYSLNATLYVSVSGKLTTRQVSQDSPGVAFVTGVPSSVQDTLEFLWL